MPATLGEILGPAEKGTIFEIIHPDFFGWQYEVVDINRSGKIIIGYYVAYQQPPGLRGIYEKGYIGAGMELENKNMVIVFKKLKKD